MKASELMVRCLENERVQFIFGIPGEENIDVMDALLDSSIRFVGVRHEQGGAFMADVYGRLSARAGVCLATLGPGATNLVTGVADANMDGGALVAITGQASLDRMHKESHQHIDVVETFRPVTKWNAQIKTARIIPEIVRKAFKVAQTEKPGATHIDFPEDVAEEQVDAAPLLAQAPPRPEPPEAQIATAAEIISAARSPIILAGNGVVRQDAAGALTRFAEQLNIPVAETFMGKGVLHDDHDLSLLTCGLQARDYVSCGFDRADVVIAVGYDLVEYAPERWNPDGDKKIIHVDQLPAEVDEHYIVSVGVLGDIALSLQRIADRAQASESDGYASGLRRVILHERDEFGADPSFPMKPQRVLHDLRAALGPDDILVSDVGAHKMWIARFFPCYRPNTCIISNGFAAMGIGVPGAIAAKLLYPERNVVTVTGDGGFLMNSQELETAVREGVAFVTLIFHDDSYSLIGMKQQGKFGRTSHIRFGNPDFVRYAESFGAAGYRVAAADELQPILRDALACGRPAVIDCPVDYTENLRMMEQLGALICPI
ncbi:MAG: acetolactate synthase large subunit [Spirochaetaceae bacterium]|nr:acetolactate synthase large subunit [Spirochaetaceae bacterium]